MLHATELLGGEAYDVQGNFVGRVTELFIEPADQPNRVARYLLDRGQISAAAGAARPDLLRGAGDDPAERGREGAGALSSE